MRGQEDTDIAKASAPPLRWQVENGGATLAIHWSDGCTGRVDADTLWRNCPSAFGKRRRMDGVNTPPPGIAITATRPIGGYGVNIAFSDGHDRGIYTWALLVSLIELPRVCDFLASNNRSDNDNALSASRNESLKGAD